jgi:TRAP-type C4-dicarboxylate transport system substrate-binding protein
MKGKALMIVLFAGLLIIGFPFHGTAKTLVLKWASYQPPTSPFTTSQRWFMDEVERISKGKVKFKAYWAQSLVGSKEMMEAVRDGVADITFPCPSYFRSKVPYSSLTDVAFLNTAGQGGRQNIVWTRVSLSPILKAEFDRWNAVYLFSSHVPPYNLMGKVPVRSLKDIDGKRIRALGGLGDLLKSFGAVPVFAPAPETFTALDRGVMDLAAGCGDYWFDAYKVAEASKYYTLGMDMSSACCQALINKRSYKKLPEEVKKALPELREKSWYISQEALAGAEKIQNWRKEYRGKGIEIMQFPAEDRIKMKQAASNFWEEWIAKWEKQGVKHAREALNLVKNMVAIVEQEYPQEMLVVPDEILKQIKEIEARVKEGKGR